MARDLTVVGPALLPQFLQMRSLYPDMHGSTRHEDQNPIEYQASISECLNPICQPQ